MLPARVAATSLTAKTAIEDCFDLAVSSGAEVHTALRISERDGHISLHADAPDGETLIRLPEDLLVPVDGITWDASDDELSITQYDPTMTAIQRELADALVAVYNATGKIRWARTTLPAVALQDDPQALSAARLLRPAFGRQQQSVAEAFIGTRVFRHSSTRRGVDAPASPNRLHLMPIIDLLNHRPQGAPFRVHAGAMTIPIAHVGGSTQCFVRYGKRYDALDLALGHGYVDPTVTFARSGPVRAAVSGIGTVEVDGRYLAVLNNLDPPKVTMESGRLSLSHVTFDELQVDRTIAILELAVAAYLRRYASSGQDASVVSRTVVTALARANLDRLGHSQVLLDGLAGDTARMLTAAVGVQRLVIDRVVLQLRS